MTSVTASTPTASAATSATSATSARRDRLEFLDVLRGVAALLVAVQHGTEAVSPAYLRWSVEVFRPGEFGVVLFFLVSGFIIPASIERHHSLRKFWIGRAFRLFPLYWAATAMALLIHVTLDRYPLPSGFTARPWSSTLVNLTMVQDFLHVDPVIGASWSLSYELVFYLLISLVFVLGVNQRSVQLSVAATASIVLLGLFLPGGIISTAAAVPGVRAHLRDKPLLFVAMATIAVIWLSLARARGQGHRRAAVIIPLVTLPLLFNQPRDLWFSLTLLAMMFAGTVFFRMAAGSVYARAGAPAVAFALTTAVVTMWSWIAPHPGLGGAQIAAIPEILTFGGAVAVFTIAYLARSLRFPRVLTWLGTVSYSVYLVHGLVLRLLPQMGGPVLGVPAGVLSVVMWVAVTVAVSALTYRFIELPGQRLGRTLIRRLGASTGHR
jgi:peptidoglycan/LPS O-acetylase OafA/YrhL